MFSRNFYQAICCALFALCFLSSACSSKQTGSITRQQVSAFLEEMEKAANNRDIEAIMSHISPDAQFKVTIEGFGATQNLALTHDQYRDYMTQGFNALESYEYKRGNTVINIEPDGQTAFVADEEFETATMKGQVIRTVATGTSTLKLEDGKLVIVSSNSVGRPAPPTPAAKRVSFK
jgi:ketosteroid isomerase-like protein